MTKSPDMITTMALAAPRGTATIAGAPTSTPMTTTITIAGAPMTTAITIAGAPMTTPANTSRAPAAAAASRRLAGPVKRSWC
ncbi:MAG: hypothetical protein LBP95_13280 [Deltaproteobacteria bacterium]|nr:hypothetical protein [Deltaproteobacteria bacterium]